MSEQLILDLPVRTLRGRGDFFVSPANALALATLEAPQGWPDGKLVLTGAPGTGKSHLARVWADENQAQVLGAGELASLDPGLQCCAAVVVEDADRLAGQRPAELALFHLHNLVLAANGRLLLTARTPPNRWPLILPDLASRLQATACVTLEPPDDALLAAVLVKLFADRQIAVTPALIHFLVARMERSAAAAGALVARLDAAALARGRPVSRGLAAEILDAEILVAELHDAELHANCPGRAGRAAKPATVRPPTV